MAEHAKAARVSVTGCMTLCVRQVLQAIVTLSFQPLLCWECHLQWCSCVCQLSRAPSQAATYRRPKGAFGLPSGWYCCAETRTGTRLNMRSCSGSVTGCRFFPFLRCSRLLMPFVTSACGCVGSKEAGPAFLGRLMPSVLRGASPRRDVSHVMKQCFTCLASIDAFGDQRMRLCRLKGGWASMPWQADVKNPASSRVYLKQSSCHDRSHGLRC